MVAHRKSTRQPVLFKVFNYRECLRSCDLMSVTRVPTVPVI